MGKLREAEVLMAKAGSVADAGKAIGGSRRCFGVRSGVVNAKGG